MFRLLLLLAAPLLLAPIQGQRPFAVLVATARACVVPESVQYLLGLPDKLKPAEVTAHGEAWRPYRSAAALLVWNHYTDVAAVRRREQSAARKGSVD